ncbi:MAG: TPM domain-containing protein [Oscillospiraceae bacterium]
MKQRIAILLALILAGALLLSTAVWAEEGRVFDGAGLFDASQRAELEAALAQTREQTGLDLAVVTAEDTGGKSAEAFADDFYDENGLGVGAGDDGALLLIDLFHREVQISTFGAGTDLLNDERIESLLDDIAPSLTDGRYVDAAHAYLTGVGAFFDAGIAENQHRYDTETGKVTRYRSISGPALLLCAALALAAGGAAVGGVVFRYRMKTTEATYNFRDRSRMQLDLREDTFLGQAVTSRRIAKANSGSGGGGSGGSSGRSSTHRSSSGRSHGGGGRGF